MNGMLKASYTKPLILYLVAALLAVSTFVKPAKPCSSLLHHFRIFLAQR